MKALLWILFATGCVAFNPFRTRSDIVFDTNSTCPKFECHPPTMNFTRGTCVFPQNNTFYLQRCYYLGNQTYCNFNSTTLNSTCTTPAPKNATVLASYPGEPCKAQGDCIFGSCLNGKCKGSSAQGSCVTHLQCDPNMRCFNGTCQGLLPVGFSGCVNDFDCVPNAGCNITTHGGTGVCVPYFSIPVGAYAGGDCTANPDFSILCASGWCQKSSWISKYGTCVSAPMSITGTPVRCNQQSDCVGVTSTSTYIGSCSCGFNTAGNAYCSPFPGDVAGLSVMNKLKALVNSGILTYCNTARRFTDGCWNTFNSTFINDLEAALYYFDNYAKLQGNDDCVKSLFLNDYYQIPPITAFGGTVLATLAIFSAVF